MMKNLTVQMTVKEGSQKEESGKLETHPQKLQCLKVTRKSTVQNKKATVLTEPKNRKKKRRNTQIQLMELIN